MSGNDVKRRVSTPIVIGLVMLVLGLVVGVGAGRFLGRGSVLAKSGQAAKGECRTSAVRSAVAGAGPPLLRPDDPWDPFREMRSLQAEMNEMFRQSIARFHSSPLMDPFGDDAGYSLSLDVRELKDRYEVNRPLKSRVIFGSSGF